MSDAFRFTNELLRIIGGAVRLDIDKVRNYSMFLADKFEESGEPVVAKRIRKILTESDQQLRPVGVGFSRALPVDADSRFPLIEHVDVRSSSESPLLLSADQWDIVSEFLSIAKSGAQADLHGVSGAINLLMYGPPGTGKSRLARYIAKELGLDLYIARLDGVISSFLGSTSKNIRALFDFASKSPCILFLDEFDAIAKLRGDTQELGELKRVVNSFIQNLDSLGPQSIILAATNHEGLLDSAVWRRFGYRVEFSYPSSDMRKGMWTQFLAPISYSEKEMAVLIDLSQGFTGADILEVCRRINRRKIMNNKTPDLKEAFTVLKNISMGEGQERKFISLLGDNDDIWVAEYLKARNPKLYSNTTVANLLGFSKATFYRKFGKGEGEDG